MSDPAPPADPVKQEDGAAAAGAAEAGPSQPVVDA
jgi:hypothetical protein